MINKIRLCFILNSMIVISAFCIILFPLINIKGTQFWGYLSFLLLFAIVAVLLSILFSDNLYSSMQKENKSDKMQAEFIANVTHELRTPLTSIKGFVETLRAGAYKDSVTAERFLEIIDVETERLCSLVNDILLLSEIESGQADTNREQCNVEEIVIDAVSVLSGYAEKKGVSITYDIQKDMTIYANKDRIKQMLINLIDNAIKYNVEEGVVQITAFNKDINAVIAVKDTGIGIEQKSIPSIFERFYRVDKGRARSMGGTGLGLSIVKNIIKLYNGNIITNSSIGHGTEFIITLPN